MLAEAILQFGTQMSTNLMNMAEQHRLDAMRRETKGDRLLKVSLQQAAVDSRGSGGTLNRMV